jgi:medium-chain acyl-[acyl-carrier-protein] hydrolase
MKPTPWIVRPVPRDGAALRLFCFPYAGGGALVYRAWASSLPSFIDVCAIQLPGRETRLSEPPLKSMPQVIESVTDAIRPRIDRPFALFGHSLGALLAFEVACHLARAGAPPPERLMVSGQAAPHRKRSRFINGLDDDEFLDEVRKLGGTAPGVLANEDLRRLFLPLLRADIELCETYRCSISAPLSCPLTVFAGSSDPETQLDTLHEWGTHSSRRLVTRTFPGGHFFLHTEADAVIGAVSEALRAYRPLHLTHA